MKQFEVEFANSETGAARMIKVQIAAKEIAKAGGQELFRDAFVLRQAYRDGAASGGFRHVPHTVRELRDH
jgi:hypothetical protein